jgi:hypothetical protein
VRLSLSSKKGLEGPTGHASQQPAASGDQPAAGSFLLFVPFLLLGWRPEADGATLLADGQPACHGTTRRNAASRSQSPNQSTMPTYTGASTKANSGIAIRTLVATAPPR